MATDDGSTWTGRLVLAAGSMLDQPVNVLLDDAATAGFDGVGLRLSGEHAVADASALRVRAASMGLVIHDAEVYRVSTTSVDPAPLVEAAAAAGAESLLAVSDLPDRVATVDALTDLARRCDAAGVRLAIEYMAWTIPHSPIDAIAIADAVNAVVVVDLLHHHRLGAGTDELDAIVGSGRLGWVQLCDAPMAAPTNPEHWVHEARHDRLVPGHGELPLAAWLASLPSDVTVSVEVQSDDLLMTPPLPRARFLHDASRSVLAGPTNQSPSSTG